jgi:hypothetical protein
LFSFLFTAHTILGGFSMKELTPSNKLPYEKPAVIHRELMESIAGTCDANDPVNGKTGSGDNCTTTNS